MMLQSVDNKFPSVSRSAYVHSSAVVIGDVRLGKQSSVWPNAVLRGDIRTITIGERSNVQDGSVLHTSKYNMTIGDDVMVGHNVTLHSCEIGRCCLIGMGAIILDAAKIGENCLIGAGTVIPPGTVIPSGSVVIGNPYTITRQIKQDEIAYILDRCDNYAKVAVTYKKTANIL